MSDRPDEYQAHLPPDLVEETERRRAEMRRRIAQRQKVAFWQKMLGDKAGRREFWDILEDAEALESRFKYAPNGSISLEATWAAFGKASHIWSIYRSLFAIATEQIILMHGENDPAFHAQRERAATIQGEEE